MPGNFNMEDPSVQEKIRRGSHVYVPTAGKHGEYRTQPYVHQEYPKAMGALPAPKRSDFAKGAAGDVDFANAVSDWDQETIRNTVQNKTEEEAWLKKNKKAAA